MDKSFHLLSAESINLFLQNNKFLKWICLHYLYCGSHLEHRVCAVWSVVYTVRVTTRCAGSFLVRWQNSMINLIHFFLVRCTRARHERLWERLSWLVLLRYGLSAYMHVRKSITAHEIKWKKKERKKYELPHKGIYVFFFLSFISQCSHRCNAMLCM